MVLRAGAGFAGRAAAGQPHAQIQRFFPVFQHKAGNADAAPLAHSVVQGLALAQGQIGLQVCQRGGQIFELNGRVRSAQLAQRIKGIGAKMAADHGHVHTKYLLNLILVSVYFLF